MRKVKYSIRAKTITIIAIAAVVMVETAMAYFSLVSSNRNKESYKTIASNMANTVSVVLNTDAISELRNDVKDIVDSSPSQPVAGEASEAEMKTYLAQFDWIKEEPVYEQTLNFLREIERINSTTVDGISLVYVDYTKGYCVNIIDAGPSDTAYSPGYTYRVDEANKETLNNPSRGFPAYIHDSTLFGGAIVTAGSPIRYNGAIIGYAMIDVTMDTVRSSQVDSILQLFLYMTITALLLAGVALLVVHFAFNKPVGILIHAASTYDVSDPEKTHDAFQKLDIKSRDEIGVLADSMKNMENDLHTKIIELTKANEDLVSSQATAKKMTELANKDGLTGVRNKISYLAAEEALDKEISGGNRKSLRFGIAMVDLNYLKTINDDLGHDKGDAAIIKLCNILCATFAHSPVFRIGGDEFVVILRNADYRKVALLVRDFNSKIDDLQKDDELSMEEKVSAAIGYSVFDPRFDTCVKDVFKRADDAMYKRKRAMKGESDK